MDAEHWLPTLRSPDYLVSDHGRVKSLMNRKERILKPYPHVRYGHPQVSLTIEGKARNYYVHSLVLETFVGVRPAGAECCHANGNSGDNRLSNLRWDTRQANRDDMVRHGTSARGSRNGNAKLSEIQVVEILDLRAAGHSSSALSRLFSVSERTIRDIISRHTWRHLDGNPIHVPCANPTPFNSAKAGRPIP